MELINGFADADDQRNYEDLVISLTANPGKMNLLLAVCDDENFRQEVIDRYEKELGGELPCYRVKIPPNDPSLKGTLATLVDREKQLQETNSYAVVTVLGIDELQWLKLNNEPRSQQEVFFGYLQWTREGLRSFSMGIVLWLTQQILIELSRKAPDFYSWCRGVFRFSSQKNVAVNKSEIAPLLSIWQSNWDDENAEFIPLADLQNLIADMEKQGKSDPLLSSLYQRMGKIYAQRSSTKATLDYQVEQNQAIKYFEKAINLQRKLKLELDLADSLTDLASLYYYQGRYSEAINLLEESIVINRMVLHPNHPDLAANMNNLALLYQTQKKYLEAEELYQEAVEVARASLPPNHPNLAHYLNNLALLYYSQGHYSEAEVLYQEAVAIYRLSLPPNHPDLASILNNLALLYQTQRKYAEAEALYQEALAIDRVILPHDHPDLANSLNNLAGIYRDQGRYLDAEKLYEEALEIARVSLPPDHPSLAHYLSNLAMIRSSQSTSHIPYFS